MDRIDEIHTRLAGAHEGMPWEAWEGCVTDQGGEVVCHAAPLDAQFIAHAPADIAWLLAENYRLHMSLVQLRDEVERLQKVEKNREKLGAKLRDYMNSRDCNDDR